MSVRVFAWQSKRDKSNRLTMLSVQLNHQDTGDTSESHPWKQGSAPYVLHPLPCLCPPWPPPQEFKERQNGSSWNMHTSLKQTSGATLPQRPKTYLRYMRKRQISGNGEGKGWWHGEQKAWPRLIISSASVLILVCVCLYEACVCVCTGFPPMLKVCQPPPAH